ncbi:MAG: hypothetical protein MHM6MM_000142 [Cercozoa sp. M6MM]
MSRSPSPKMLRRELLDAGALSLTIRSRPVVHMQQDHDISRRHVQPHTENDDDRRQHVKTLQRRRSARERKRRRQLHEATSETVEQLLAPWNHFDDRLHGFATQNDVDLCVAECVRMRMQPCCGSDVFLFVYNAAKEVHEIVQHKRQRFLNLPKRERQRRCDKLRLVLLENKVVRSVQAVSMVCAQRYHEISDAKNSMYQHSPMLTKAMAQENLRTALHACRRRKKLTRNSLRRMRRVQIALMRHDDSHLFELMTSEKRRHNRENSGDMVDIFDDTALPRLVSKENGNFNSKNDSNRVADNSSSNELDLSASLSEEESVVPLHDVEHITSRVADLQVTRTPSPPLGRLSDPAVAERFNFLDDPMSVFKDRVRSPSPPAGAIMRVILEEGKITSEEPKQQNPQTKEKRSSPSTERWKSRLSPRLLRSWLQSRRHGPSSNSRKKRKKKRLFRRSRSRDELDEINSDSHSTSHSHDEDPLRFERKPFERDGVLPDINIDVTPIANSSNSSQRAAEFLSLMRDP